MTLEFTQLCRTIIKVSEKPLKLEKLVAKTNLTNVQRLRCTWGKDQSFYHQIHAVNLLLVMNLIYDEEFYYSYWLKVTSLLGIECILKIENFQLPILRVTDFGGSLSYPPNMMIYMKRLWCKGHGDYSGKRAKEGKKNEEKQQEKIFLSPGTP